MKIKDVQTILLTGPCTNDPYTSELRKRRSAAFVEITTDTELVGIGETYAGYFCPEMVPEIVRFFAPILQNQSVDNIDQLWRRMYQCGNFWCRVGLGLSVLNGIEAALWDLKGKMLGVPVYELLGGRKHERILCYATGGPSNYPVEKLLSKVDHYLSLGFKAFKVAAGRYTVKDGFEISGVPAAAAELEARKAEILRSHVGGSVEIMLDGHMGNSPDVTWTVATALAVMRALEPYGLFFFEEPLHYTDPGGYAELRSLSPIPIAGGECLTGTAEWRAFVDNDCFDIGQPDAAFSGGLGVFMKVASLMEGRGRSIATHAWGAGGSLAQNLHCGFAAANTIVLETPPDYGPLHSEVLAGTFMMRDGYALPPEKPGLGIELPMELRRRFPFVPGSGEFNSVPGKPMGE